MNTKLLLVARDGEAKQAYLDTIKHFDIDVDTVSSIMELYKTMINTPYNGVMIDAPTKIKASKEEKTLVHEILDKFPVIQLKWEGKTCVIKTLFHNQYKTGGTLNDFINQECLSFNPRTIRASVRKNINFNVILANNDDFSEENIERTVTIDVSKGGCFIYSPEKRQSNSNIWFIINELDDNTPIRSEVMWSLEWGKAMRIPSIGVMFTDIKSCQLENISDKINL